MDNSLVIMRDHITRGCYAKCVRTVLRQVDSHYYIEELYEKRLGAPSTCWQMAYDGAANHFNKCAQIRERLMTLIPTLVFWYQFRSSR